MLEIAFFFDGLLHASTYRAVVSEFPLALRISPQLHWRCQVLATTLDEDFNTLPMIFLTDNGHRQRTLTELVFVCVSTTNIGASDVDIALELPNEVLGTLS